MNRISIQGASKRDPNPPSIKFRKITRLPRLPQHEQFSKNLGVGHSGDFSAFFEEVRARGMGFLT